MVSYTAPAAPVIENPVGLDREIQRLQLLLLSEVPWLKLSYGKAYRGFRKDPGTQKAVYYPEVYAGNREYRDVLPNDNVQAQSFFYPTGPAVNPAREPLPNTLGLTQAVDLIMWANLERIDAKATHRIEHELLLKVLKVLNDDGQVRILRAFTTNEEIFRGFSLELVPETVLRQPYCGFRVQLELNVTNVLECEPAKPQPTPPAPVPTPPIEVPTVPIPPVEVPEDFALASSVAAGIYSTTDGRLLRTLYAGTTKTREEVVGLVAFDLKDDKGEAIVGATQLRKQLPNKLVAKFTDLIGNSSPQALTNKIPFAQDDQGNNVVGSNVWFGFRPFNCISIGPSDTKAYIGQGYTEGPQSHGAFALNDIQTRVNYQKIPGADRLTQATCYQDQDADKVYHLGYDGIDVINSGLSGTLPDGYYRDYKSQWFIYATSKATGERVAFSAGTNYAVMQGSRPQISYNGYQFAGRCAGLAVQKTGSYLYVSLPDTNEIIVLNKSTMAYVRSIKTFTRPGALLVDRENRLWVASQNPGTPNTTPVKLSGEPVGAAGYGTDFQHSIDKGFDGNPNTYYASSANVPYGWLGLYVGPGVVITSVRLSPSAGREADCQGWVQLSNANNNDHARDRRTVARISTPPVAGKYTSYPFDNTRPWSYVRVFNPGKPFKGKMEVWGYKLADTQVTGSYAIAADGTLTATGVTLSNPQEVTALTDDHLGNLYTREGGNKQGVSRYAKATGGAATATWTQSEDVKFYFTDAYGTLLHNQESPAPLACAPDGSVWVGDTGNERLVHLSPTGAFIEAIYYASHSRACVADANDPTRLLGENREYTLAIGKPFPSNNRNWKLAFNWNQSYNTQIYGYLREVATLSNGRTYAVVAHEEFAGQPMRHVVELVKGVGVRFTGTVLPQGSRLEASGHVVRITYTFGQPIQTYERRLTGFDAAGNPQWAAEVALLPGPVPQLGDPGPTNIRRFANGLHVVHDGSRVQAGGSPDYHVAGWREGKKHFDFKTARATSPTYIGKYPEDGSFDTGNNVQNPGGPMTLLVDRTAKPLRWFVWCYMGEGWGGKQCCYFHVIDADTGLLVLKFGSDAFTNQPSMTSVVLGMAFMRLSDDKAILIVNEEGGRGFGAWGITGLASFAYSVSEIKTE